MITLSLFLFRQLAIEKERLMKETASQRQKVEQEIDDLRAEHIQTISSLKAEMASRARQIKVSCHLSISNFEKLEEKQRVEDIVLQFRREKEKIESDHATEIDNLLQQNKSSLIKIKAQLEVRHEEEIKALQRKHENVSGLGFLR
jgi:hypothetical protein